MTSHKSPDAGYVGESPAVVDEALQRALRAAVRPALPNATAAAPIVVGFTSVDRAAATPMAAVAAPRGDAAFLPETADGGAAQAGAMASATPDEAAIVEMPLTAALHESGLAGAPRETVTRAVSFPPGTALQPVGEAGPALAEVPRQPGEEVQPRPPEDPPSSLPPVTLPFSEELLPVADPPRLTVADATTDEDTAVPLIIEARIADLDGRGGESLTIIIANLPPGATLSAGQRLADGTWRLLPADLDGLTLTPGRDWSGTVVLEVRAVSSVGDGNDAITIGEISLTVTAVADAPDVSASGHGAEDSAILLNAGVAVTDIDGSETITAIKLLGVPAGATLSAGTREADGSWTLSPSDLPGLTLTPPLHFSGAIALSLVATSSEPNGSTATTQHDFTVIVTAVADAPAATVADAAGREDQWIALTGLSAALVDQDGSETLTVWITGVPDGAQLSHGTNEGGGSWRVSVEDLASLSLLPPPHAAGEIALRLVARSEEAEGGSAVTELGFSVTVTPVVDGGHLGAQASGQEDSWITIHTSLGALVDGSERWADTVLVSGVPDGATLSQGEALGGGTWRVATAALAAGDIAIRPPLHSDEDIVLTLTGTVIDAEGGMEARQDVATTVTVRVAAVADAPAVTASNAAGNEDQWIPLGGLSAALVDQDGSETLAVTIAGVPAGATLSAGADLGDGVWSVPAASLATLSLLPPEHYSGEITLTLRAVSTEAAGGSATTEASFSVTVAPIVDQGSISITGVGDEDTWITIAASFFTPDQDGSESWAATTSISGVPNGATLSHGVQTSPGTWVVETATLAAGQLKIRPPENSDADITLTFRTTLSDTAGDVTARREIEGVGTIIVTAVADAPTVKVADLTGLEDKSVRLAGLGGALSDTDGSETLSFRISGMPQGSRLTAGTRNADGSWTLTPAQLSAASFVPPPHRSGTYTLTLTAIAKESEAGVPTASTSDTFRISIDPVADQGRITMSATGAEDSWITIKPIFTTPDRDGSETWSATTTVSGVPAGALLSHGSEVRPGVWEVLTAELSAGKVRILPPQNSDADIILTFEAVLTDRGNGKTDTRTITGQATVTVTAVADDAAVTVADAAGNEDQWISLTGLSAALTDTDGSETLTVTILGVPPGAMLSHGTASGGVWTVEAADLASLAIRPPRDFSGEIALTLRAVSSEARDGSTATVEAGFTVSVAGVADTPTIRAVSAIGFEDTPIALTIDGRTTDIDGSERITFYRIADVPTGAVLATSAGPLTPEADGTYLVPVALAGSLTVTPPRDDARDFTLRVSAIASEPNGSTAESAAVALPVTVIGVADAAVGVSGGGTAAEDMSVPLNIVGALSDTDGSEALSFLVGGVSDGMTLTHGTYAGPGRWSLTPEEAAQAALVVPRDWAGEVALTLTAVTQERDGGSSMTVSVPITVTVQAVIDAPKVGGLGGSVARWQTARGYEDSAIALTLDPGLTDRDGSEQVVGSIIIGNVPAGAVLRLADGTVLTPGAGGNYTIPASRIGDVEIIPPPDSDVAFDLSVTMTIEDTGGVRETIAGLLTVDPVGVADTPLLRVADAAVAGHRSTDPSEGWVPLEIRAAPLDGDGSETVHVVIYDVPAGFMLSAGRNMGEGTWVLAPGEERGLMLRPPAGYEGGVSLTVSAFATEREGDVAAIKDVLTLKIAGDGSGAGGGSGGDPGTGGGGGAAPPPEPVLVVALADGREDEPLALRIMAKPAGDGSETITYVVSDLPAGATLSAGWRDPASGRWLLTEKDLDRLTLIPPADHAGAVAVTVTAVATSPLGAVSTTSSVVKASLEAVADAPSISTSPGAGAEDQAIALNLAALPGDRDGSETITAILISDVPAGATLTGPGITDNGDGTFSIDPAHAGALAIIPPPHAHGDFAVTVTVRATEASNGDTRETVRRVGVSVAAVADAPLLTATAAAGDEDQPIPLSISAALADTDGSEMLSIVISGLPVGAILSAGVNNGDGSWTLTPAQLTGLTVTAPHNMSGTINATVTAYAIERSNGSIASTTVPLAISVNAVADAPIVDAPSSRSGDEDMAIPVNLRAWLTDTDGSETLTVTATQVPAGGTFNRGTANPDGSWSFTAAQLDGLSFTPPPHVSGDITIRFMVTATEGNGDTASVPADITFTVKPVTDAADISVAPAQALEGQPVPLSITVALIDADGSEEITRVTIAGLPAGATLSAGIAQNDGSWLLSPAELAGLMLQPAPGWSGTVNLTVTAETRELASDARLTTTVLPVTVEAVATAPSLTVSPATGAEDGTVNLSISAALVDTDGSEELTGITISGLPPGATLSAGALQADGSWLLSPAQLSGLMLIPAPNWSGTATLAVTAQSRETSNDDRASITRALPVTITAVADAPMLSGTDARGEEGSAIPLTISAALTDTDGSETLGPLIVSGLPSGFTLSAGASLGGGAWTVPAAAIPGLALVAPAGWTGSLVLSLSITATEAAGPSAQSTAQLTVTVEDLLRPPVVELTIATPVASGTATADLIGQVAVSEPDGDAIVSATVTLGVGRDPSDRIVVTGYTLTPDGDDLVIGDTGIRVVGGGLDPATGVLTLSGSASASSYAAVLDALSLVNGDGGALAIGTRSVTVTLTDATGESAADATQLIVASSVIAGDGIDQTLQGTPGDDVFIGSSGNETMRGTAGNDLFLIETVGGDDIVQGGGGFDTIFLKGVTGGPVGTLTAAGDWTLVLDANAPEMSQDQSSITFSEAASGRIVFGDGSQVEFSQLERISW
jgi:hypothetical protein